MLVQLADVHFAYPGTEIFSGLSFQVNPGDRIGLVGPNGAGKSTLLRLLSGALEPDRGQVARPRGVRVAYLHQSQEFSGAGTLWDTLMVPFAELLAMRAELAGIEDLLTRDGSGDEHQKHLDRYGELQEIYGRRGGYSLEAQARKLADELGFHEEDLARSVDTLSGGERGRLELARVLLEQPDLLLLDEPTNHLDLEAVEHLEERLREWPTAFVLVSHDRWFLRAVCSEIVDVEQNDLVRYPGGWDRYLIERAERHERMRAAYERQQDKIERTQDFIRRNIAGQKTKQAQSRRKMLEKLERLDQARDDWADAGDLRLHFSVGDHPGGKEAVRAVGLAAGYAGAPPVVKDLDLVLYRGERLGIIGPNGAGKSTLVKTLLGRLQPRDGIVSLGHEVRVGYYDQKMSDLDEDRSLIDEVRSIRGDWNEDVARNFLGSLRFSGDDGFRKVKGLSGGERGRLALGKMMLRPRNLLVFDEPTNHLDIPACEVLEEALSDYEGTLLVISHDRFFLDKVCDRILHVDGPEAGGTWDLQLGNYSDWRERKRAEAEAAKDKAREKAERAKPGTESRAPKPSARPEPPRDAAPDPDAEKRARLQEREQKKTAERDRARKEKRLAELETLIAGLEEEVAHLRAQLAGDHGGDWQRLHTLAADESERARRLESLMSEWEKLGAELS